MHTKILFVICQQHLNIFSAAQSVSKEKIHTYLVQFENVNFEEKYEYHFQKVRATSMVMSQGI